MKALRVATAVVTTLCSAPAMSQTAAPGASAPTGSPSPASPELDPQTLPDIIVTAQKSASTAQKTPISIAVVSGNELRAQASTSLDDVLKNVTGVEVQGAGRGLQLAIRGIGSDLPPGVGEGAVSTNFDGVYNLRAESGQLGYFDVDRVEVLRGPQSTLYGRNATGGVVNIISADPILNDTSARVTIGAGNYDLLQGEAAANISRSDTVAARIAITSINRDGYLSDGRDDQVGTAARLKLLFQPTADARIILGVEGTKIGGRGPGQVDQASFNAGNKWGNAYPKVASQDYKSIKIWADGEITVGPGVLHILPAWQSANATTFSVGGTRSTLARDPRKVDQRSVEARYQNRPGSPVQWTAGYYYFDYDQSQLEYVGSYDAATNAIEYPTALNLRSNTSGRSHALFGQVTVPLTDTFRVTGGYRHTWDQRTSAGLTPTTQQPYDVTVRGNFNDYRVGVEYDPSANVMAYATFATAFRAGGVNNFDATPFAPERLKSYEAGMKSRWLNRKLQLNASIYYYDYDDFQASNFYLVGSRPVITYSNADARNFGQEVEAVILPTGRDRLRLSVLHMQTKILSDLIINPTPVRAVNIRGDDMTHSPHWTIKGGYSHDFDLFDGRLSPQVDIRYVSSQKVTPNPDPVSRQDAYATGDLLLGWVRDGYTVTAYVKNVNDRSVVRFYAANQLYVAAPRTYGVTFGASF